MTNAELLKQAETDLAFALAQGDGYAEDEAAERIARLKARLKDAESYLTPDEANRA
jgi:hypothetical protein